VTVTSDSRTILTATVAERMELWTLLSTLAIAEMTHPSEDLWIASPWISDIPMVDDSVGRFRAINPFGKSRIGLVDLLLLLGERGTRVAIVTRPGGSDAFASALTDRAAQLPPGRVRVLLLANLHAKGWATPAYSVSGSMNFTFSGRAKWDELVTLKQGEDGGELLGLFKLHYGEKLETAVGNAG
jgi:hypothetical protein